MEQLLELLQGEAKLTPAQLAVMLGEREEDVVKAIQRLSLIHISFQQDGQRPHDCLHGGGHCQPTAVKHQGQPDQ